MTDVQVTAVFVTYGDRTALLKQSICASVAAGVDQIVVVANGYSIARVAELEAALAPFFDKIVVLNLPENLGSAAGFGVGIRTALRHPGDYLWLLDDDNAPDPNALVELRSAIETKSESLDVSHRAWVSYRPARGYQRALANGGDWRSAFPARSSFMYFHIRRCLTRHRTTIEVTPPPRVQRIPYGPYGGFFAHRSLFEAIGEPDTSLVLYEDDTEYTNRVVRLGGTLWFVPTSRIADIDDNWLAPGHGHGPTRLLDARPAFRVYYSVRNRVNFERRYWRRGKYAYLVNRLVFVGVISLLAARRRRLGRLQLILRAVSDGERGRLGLRQELPLP